MVVPMQHVIKTFLQDNKYRIFMYFMTLTFFMFTCLAQKTTPATTLTNSVAGLQLEDTMIVKDSVKSMVYNVYRLDSVHHKHPVSIHIQVYVKRTFSDLKIGTLTTNKEGYGEIVIPSGIPGDSAGNLILNSRIENHPLFGTVEKVQIIDCGIPTNYQPKKFQRTLWTTVAPIWMIVTLTILLVGVWMHFFYVLLKIYYIRRENK